MDQIFGIVEKLCYQNEENGYAIIKIKQPRKKELTTIRGALFHLKVGQNVKLLGEWQRHPNHGLQFEVSNCAIEEPEDCYSIQKYLESGLIYGIGPKVAGKIVEKFLEESLNIIDQTPERLLEIPGIGKKRLAQITASWESQKSIRDVMVFLQKYQVSPSYAQKIFKTYGEKTIEVMQANPFQLAKHISGIGFKIADRIAEKMGLPHNADSRMDAAIEYCLQQLASQGHVCSPLEELLAQATAIVANEVSHRLKNLENEHVIAIKNLENRSFIWLKKLYLAECAIVDQLARLKKGKSPLRKIDSEKAIEWVEKKFNIELAKHQKNAIMLSCKEKIHIITGGPGTGKSTITKSIVAIHAQLTPHIILAAPTGRAAKRLSEITRHPASTIHSLLQYDFKTKGFRRNAEYPLVCDLLIIDEASMIDTLLMMHLLKAIPNHARVLFVGDVHQLPSVGPGQILKDLIESKKFSTTYLTEIFRQAKNSRIITNAHQINEGIFPDISIENNNDFFFINANTPEEIVAKTVDLATNRIPKRYRLDPIEHIQVLCPMRRGEIGIEQLNLTLQKVLNSNTRYLAFGDTHFIEGDKVMQIRNNYQKEVFNGDMGRVQEVDLENGTLLVKFEQKIVPYTRSELDELVLGYATSVHKYQGSEAACVIIPLHTSHFMMLQRNLLYTAVTRGKKLVILVGQAKAIGIAVANNQATKRYSGLFYFLESLA